jgi:hypothetical protein
LLATIRQGVKKNVTCLGLKWTNVQVGNLQEVVGTSASTLGTVWHSLTNVGPVHLEGLRGLGEISMNDAKPTAGGVTELKRVLLNAAICR